MNLSLSTYYGIVLQDIVIDALTSAQHLSSERRSICQLNSYSGVETLFAHRWTCMKMARLPLWRQ